MSDYPVWWDTTITVYNKFTDPETKIIKWYSTVLYNCFWKDVGTKINVGNTSIETNDIICRIPVNENFREKYLWINIPNDEMSNFFTLGKGDIIVRGEISDEINEYKSGNRSTDLLAKYKEMQGCMQIKKLTIDTGNGRNNEHYYVIGE